MFKKFFISLLTVMMIVSSNVNGNVVFAVDDSNVEIIDEFDSHNATKLASGSCGTWTSWTLYDDGLLDIKNTSNSQVVIIDGYSTDNPAPWNSYADSIKKVVVNERISQVGSYAFYNLPALEEVILSEGIESIGVSSFANCDSLHTITFPSTLKTIYKEAFKSCGGLGEVILPEGLTELGISVFKASSIEDVSLPSTLKDITEGVFENCKSLNTVAIAKGVTRIKGNAFMGCTSLQEIMLPSSVRTISSEAFSGCTALKTVNNLASVSLGYNAFYNCSKLESINKVSGSIPNDTFYYCSSLRNIDISEVGSIYETAFNMCAVNSIVFEIGANENMYEYVKTNGYTYTSSLVDLTLSVTEVEFDVHTQYQLDVVLTPSFANVGADITWSSSDESIATVDQSGLVTGIAGGRATISATSSNGMSKDCEVTVVAEVASGDISDSMQWTYYSNGLLDITGSGEMTNYTISSLPWKNYTVNITDIRIAEGITSIGDYAFYNFELLKSVSLPSSLVGIGNSSFYYCKKLESIDLPSGLQEIKNKAFGYTGLTSIVLPSGMTTLGNSAFADSPIVEISIPNTLTSIGTFVFSNTKVVEVSLPEGLTSVSAGMFSGCKSLVRVTLPSTITTIDGSVFNGCTSLESVNIPDKVNNIGFMAFGAAKTVVLTILDNSYAYNYAVTNNMQYRTPIKSMSFDSVPYVLGLDCSNTFMPTVYPSYANELDLVWSSSNEEVASVDASGVVTGHMLGTTVITAMSSSGVSASFTLETYKAITGVSLQTSEIRLLNGKTYQLVATITPEDTLDDKTLTYTSSDESIATVDQNGVITAVSSGSATITVTTNNGKTDSCVVNVYSVVNSGQDTANITWTYYDNGLLEFTGSGSMNDYAAGVSDERVWYPLYRDQIKEVVISEGITSVGNAYFWMCSKIESITLPESVSRIGRLAFGRCTSLSSIEIPSAVTTFEYGVFNECSSLTSVAISNTVTSIEERAFEDSGLVEIVIPDSVESIGIYAFVSCDDLVSVQLPNQLQTISNSMFSGCTSLQAITIPASVTKIEDTAFYRCTSLLDITVPSSVTSIGNAVFYECTSLKNVNILGNVEVFGTSLFRGCTSLTDVILPSALKTVGGFVFMDCTSLETFALPNTVESIGNNAFNGCSSLTSFVMPNSVTSLGNTVFDNCLNLVIEIYDNAYAYEYVKANNYSYKTVVRGISFEEESIRVGVNDTVSLEVILEPYYANSEVNCTWSSSDENVATVNQDGVVSGVGEGNCVITVTTENGYLASINVESYISILHVTLNEDSLSLDDETTFQLEATISPADAKDDLTLTWTSSDEKVAVVDANGLVTAKGSGIATITVTTSNGKQDTCMVTVYEDIYSLALNTYSVELNANETFQVEAIYEPEYTHTTIQYQSDDTSVVTVDENGVLTAVSSGKTRIVVLTSNGLHRYCDVTVYEPISNIALNMEEVSLNKGQTTQLETIYEPEYTKSTITWSSSNPSVATVDENGLVTAVYKGTTTIMATTSEGLQATSEVVVHIPLKSFYFKVSNTIMDKGTTKQLVPIFDPVDTSEDTTITWVSTNQQCVTVDQNGLVTAVGVGYAVVKGILNNGKEAWCSIDVVSYIKDVTLDVEDITLRQHDTYQLVGTINPSDTTQSKTLTWTSSNEEVATVDENGVITAVNSGTTIITVKTSNGMTDSCAVTVLSPIREIVLNHTSETLFIDDTLQVIASYTPEYTYSTLTWTSSNEEVATVDENGLVKAVYGGTTTITITTSEGVSASCVVDVVMPIEKIELETKEISLDKDATYQLVGNLTPSDTTDDQTLVWTSSDENVATVDTNGLVKAIYSGVATITVTASNGMQDTCVVTVYSNIDSITLDKQEATVEANDTLQLVANYTPAITKSTLTWTTSDENVATVDTNGLVKAICSGKATITVTTSEGLYATCEITVVSPITDIEFENTNMILNRGEYALLKTTYTPEYTNSTLTWTSSNEDVASVSDGVVLAKNSGTTTITVTTSEGLSASCEVTVIVTIQKFELSANTVSMNIDETYQLEGIFTPSDTTEDTTIVWTSSNNNVATVDENGLVTAMYVGNTTITAIASNGMRATCEVTVDVEVNSIELNTTSAVVTTSHPITLYAKVQPLEVLLSNKVKLKWSSSNEEVATVDENGVVTGISNGTATITASVDGISATCTVTVRDDILYNKNIKVLYDYIVENGDVDSDGYKYIEIYNDATYKISIEQNDEIHVGMDEQVFYLDKYSDINSTTVMSEFILSKEGPYQPTDISMVYTQTSIYPKYSGYKYVLAEINPLTYNGNSINNCREFTSSLQYLYFGTSEGLLTKYTKMIFTETNKLLEEEMGLTWYDLGFTAFGSPSGNVVVSAEEIVLPDTLVLEKGYKSTLNEVILPTNAQKPKITWVSSNPSVVTVDSLGVVTGKSVGKAVVVGTLPNGAYDYCEVSVEVKITNVVLNKSSIDLLENETFDLVATIRPQDTTQDKTLVWTSSNENIATVNQNGHVVAKGLGTADITVTASNGVKAICKVNVVKPVTDITLDKTNMELAYGASGTLQATVYPSDTTFSKNITWSSSNTSVVSVDSNGKVTAKNLGSAVITAKTVNGLTATCTVSVYLGKPSATVAKASSTSSKLTWSKVSGANGYEIHRSTSYDGEYTNVKSLTSSYTTWTNTGLTSGTSYYYKVRAYRTVNGVKVYSEFSDVLAFVIMGTPTITVTALDYDTVTVSWKSVNGVDNYEIYRSTDNKTFTQLMSTTDTTYVDEGLLTNTTYYYKVRAVKDAVIQYAYGTFSTVKSAKPVLKVPAVQTSHNGKDTIYVEWETVEGASGYEIHRATSSSGAYTKLSTLSDTYYQEAAASGKNYYYRVRAYRINTDGSKVYGSYSSAMEAAIVSTPVIKVAKASSTSLKVSWNKVSGATGYEVYRSTALDGTYKKVKTITKGTTLSWTDTKKTNGTTYFYKVRAYRTVGKKKVYSTYSDVYGYAILSTPVVTAKRDSYDSIKLTWKTIKKATGYEIYRSTSKSGTYELINTVSDLSYVDNDLLTAKTYYYKVKAIKDCEVSIARSSYSTVKYAKTTLSTPKTTITNPDYQTINLSWNAIDGVDTYEVRRATKKDGTYTVVGETSDLTFNDTNVTLGKTYYYKVRGYHNNVDGSKGYSSYSAIVSKKVIVATPKVTVTNPSYDKNVLDWQDIPLIKEYQVYRSTSKTGTYTKIATLLDSYYEDTTVVVGKTYYYKVRAVVLVNGIDKYSSYSTIVSKKVVLPKPVNVIGVRDVSGVTLTYDAVYGAEGYEIYRATSSTGTYSKVATLSETMYVDSTISASKNYYYKVRAYRLVNGKKVYSSYSSVVKCLK